MEEVKNEDVKLNQQRMRLNALSTTGKLSGLQASQVNAAELTKERNALKDSRTVSEAMEKLAIGRGQTSAQWKAIRNARAAKSYKEQGRARENLGKGNTGHGFNYTKEDNPYVEPWELAEIMNLGEVQDKPSYSSVPEHLTGTREIQIQDNVNHYYDLWKSDKKKYSHLPSYIERTYGNEIRQLSKDMDKSEQKDGGLFEKGGIVSLILGSHPLLGLASKLASGIFGPKHDTHKKLDEMQDYGRYVVLPGAQGVVQPEVADPGLGAGIDWRKYSNNGLL